jgi:carboxylate-amine ligase
VNHRLERYEQMEDVYQIVARQQVICGCHVHVGIESPEQGVEVMNRARPWLPVLLALSANSPYWRGIDTGFASYRTQVWQRWPTAGMPPAVESPAEYDRLVDELVRTGAIEDPTYLYWYVRPSARHATVEFRVCDVCPDVEDTVAVAGMVRALAWTCWREAQAGEPLPQRSREAMEAAMWRASRYGIEGQLVDAVEPRSRPAAEVVAQFLDHVEDGLEAHGDTRRVRDLVDRVLEAGTGSTRQREAFRRGGERALLDAVRVDAP